MIILLPIDLYLDNAKLQYESVGLLANEEYENTIEIIQSFESEFIDYTKCMSKVMMIKSGKKRNTRFLLGFLYRMFQEYSKTKNKLFIIKQNNKNMYQQLINASVDKESIKYIMNIDDIINTQFDYITKKQPSVNNTYSIAIELVDKYYDNDKSDSEIYNLILATGKLNDGNGEFLNIPLKQLVETAITIKRSEVNNLNNQPSNVEELMQYWINVGSESDTK